MIKPSKLVKWALGHKFITGIIILVIIFGGYFGYKKLNGDSDETRDGDTGSAIDTKNLPRS